MSPPDGNTQLQSLLDRATDGDSAAYGALIARAADRLYRLARKMLDSYPRLRRWEQTDDVFQNAALRLHRSLSDVQPETVREFFGLSATQIRRTLIDLARHHFGPQGRHAKHHSDGLAADPTGGPTAVVAAKDSRPDSLEDWAAFHEAVENLPPDEREVFELLWYTQLSQIEAAQLLGISRSTLKRRWRTAQLSLGESLENPMAGEE